MPYYTFKRSGKNRYLVLRWKKRINGVPTIVKEISVGTADNLAAMLESGMSDIVLKSYSAGSTLSTLFMDKKMGSSTFIKAFTKQVCRNRTVCAYPLSRFLSIILNYQRKINLFVNYYSDGL